MSAGPPNRRSALVALALLAGIVAAAATRPAPPRGWLGVTLGDDGAGGTRAARIDTVLAEGPAAAAGLLNGDRVRQAGGRTIRAARDLTDTVRRARPGTALSLVVDRAGWIHEITATLTARPPDVYRLLEADRDAWQEPARVLALLDARAGAAVADIGAGGGYFTERLATAVGRTGSVTAVEIDPDALEQLRARFASSPIVSVQSGLAADPLLAPASLDAVLLVDTFHEVRAPEAMLAAIRRALRPDGRLVIVDRPAAAFVAGAHAIPEDRVTALAAAAGFRLRERADLRRQFALVLEDAGGE